MLKTYRVTASQLVFHECYIQAKSAHEAEELAWEGSPDWQEVHYGDWELEDCELVKKEIAA